MINILFHEPILFLLLIGALIVSLSIHEFSHAYVAFLLGDDTARYLGRVTLNPRAHIDPFGMFLLIFAGFGWGKPVPVNPINLRHPRKDFALISLAGPVSNLLLALVLAGVYHLSVHLGIYPGTLILRFVVLLIFYNVMLGIFNLIPIHPLDGFNVVRGILPGHLVSQWEQVRQFGLIILLGLVFTGTIEKIVHPVMTVILGFLQVW